MVIREAQAGNVQGDVMQISDVAAGAAQLLPEGFATSWVPPDLADKIDPRYRDPLVIANEANVWAYNTQAYDECPIENIWQLTEPEWKGKVALQDPLGKASYIDWFNQMATHGDDGDRRGLRGALRQAARDRRGDGDGGLGRGARRQRAAADRRRRGGGAGGGRARTRRTRSSG